MRGGYEDRRQLSSDEWAERMIVELVEVAERRPLSTKQVMALVPIVFSRGMYVRSMETFEVVSADRHLLRLDLSILGLEHGWEERAALDPPFARSLLMERLKEAELEPNEMLHEIWLDDLA